MVLFEIINTWNMFLSWIVREMDRKLLVACDVFSMVMAFEPAWLQIMTSPNSQVTTHLAIHVIQLNILIKKTNLTMPVYCEISNYS